MSKNSNLFIYYRTSSISHLLEASEDEFLAAIRESIRVQGRGHLIDAILIDSVAEIQDSDYNFSMEGNPQNSSDSENSEENNSGDSSDNESEIASVDEIPQDGVDRVMLHEPVLHNHIHCPPFDDISQTFCGVQCGVCDCDDYCFAVFLQEDNFEFLKNCYYTLDFQKQLQLAEDSCDEPRRKPNNELRKYFYKKCLDFGVLEKGERRRLPNCAVARIRQIYPSDTGFYMGFKEH